MSLRWLRHIYTVELRPFAQSNTRVLILRRWDYDKDDDDHPLTLWFSLQTFYSESTPQEKIHALRKACERHVKLTKECSQGLGQDRHLYAMYCLVRREIEENRLYLSARAASPTPLARSPTPSPSGGSGTANKLNSIIPSIFTDPGYSHLSTSILSTSNCGNPALRLFGFGPVAADGYGIGYIVKENGISMWVTLLLVYRDIFVLTIVDFSCASSKHLQTRRFLDTLQGYLHEIQRILVQLHRAANERPAPFVDHLGILRDSKTGRPINGTAYDNDAVDEDGDAIAMREFVFPFSLCLLAREI
jgi:carnitine O-acetyltransferase